MIHQMLSFLSQHKLHLVFVAMIVSGLTLAILALAGFYPIALVNGGFVTARSLSVEYKATDSYYRHVLEKYGAKAFGDVELTPLDIEASSMQTIIENMLIQDGAKHEAGSDLGALVQNKLSQLNKDSELQKAAFNLYGFNKSDFWNFILIPQAERDVLAGRLFLRGQKIEDWLVEAKKSAKVVIFSGQFRWNGEKVESGKL